MITFRKRQKSSLPLDLKQSLILWWKKISSDKRDLKKERHLNMYSRFSKQTRLSLMH